MGEINPDLNSVNGQSAPISNFQIRTIEKSFDFDDFQEATFKNGSLIIEIDNQLKIDLNDIYIKIKKIDGTYIDSTLISQVSAGNSKNGTIDLKDKTLPHNMLIEVGNKLNIPLIQGDANVLPFADNSFHFLTMGYALRHVDDLKGTFKEYFRVLKPGGILLILELMKPTNKMIYRIVQLYFRLMVALISIPGIGGKNEGRLIKYYWDTIDTFVGSSTIIKTLYDIGFEEVNSHQIFNFFTEYTAVKP